MLVVLDTSAFISAIRSNKGAAGEVLRLILNGVLITLLDLKLACEYRDVAFRPQHVTASGLSREQIETVITRLEAISVPVIVDVMHRPLSRDEDDNMILDIAINGNADVIVTNNIRDFAAAAGRYNIQVLAPGELLAELRLGRLGFSDADN
jgi:putative PIN family toxin of toxin-antitoxin system